MFVKPQTLINRLRNFSFPNHSYGLIFRLHLLTEVALLYDFSFCSFFEWR
jgi:hypothetical protein